MGQENVSFDWAKIREGLIKAADGYDNLQATLGYGAGRVASGLRQVAEGIEIAPDSGRGELTYEERFVLSMEDMARVFQFIERKYQGTRFRIDRLCNLFGDCNTDYYLRNLHGSMRHILARKRFYNSLKYYEGKWIAFTVMKEGRQQVVEGSILMEDPHLANLVIREVER